MELVSKEKVIGMIQENEDTVYRDAGTAEQVISDIQAMEPDYSTKPVRIRIKFHTDIEPLAKINIGDWIDLRAAEDVQIRKGEYKYISLGVSMQLPVGYEAIVAPRGSTLKQFGIICGNSHGVMDNSFCGDNDVWRFCALAVRDTEIHKGERICQFRIQKNQPEIIFETVEVLGNEDRGGYGSTGRD